MNLTQIQSQFRGIDSLILKLTGTLCDTVENFGEGKLQHWDYVNQIKSNLDDLVQTESQLRETLKMALELGMLPEVPEMKPAKTVEANAPETIKASQTLIMDHYGSRLESFFA